MVAPEMPSPSAATSMAGLLTITSLIRAARVCPARRKGVSVMDSKRSVHVSIDPGEVVQPGVAIELTTDKPVDPRSFQGALRVVSNGGIARVTLERLKRGRLLRIPTEELPPGSYRLEISELLGRNGECLVDRLTVPFALIPIAGEIPADYRVEHVVRLVVRDLDVERVSPGDERVDGYIDVVKAVHRDKDEPEDFAFDERGRRVDAGEILRDVERRRYEKFGPIQETLWQRMEETSADDRIDIVVWPRLELPPAPYEKPTDAPMEKPPEEEERVLASVRGTRKELREALERLDITSPGLDETEHRPEPFIRASATADQIRELAASEIVGAIYFDDTTEILDLGNSIAVARSDQAHAAGFDGTGIRVAVWESGPSDTTDLDFEDRFTSSPSASDHARLTSAVIKNTERGQPHGHAPDCDLYSANSGSVDALRWAARDAECRVISQSFHRSSEPKNATLQSDDLLKDWLALRWPYPTILQAAGNYWKGDSDNISPPQDEYVNHKGFNSLAVGNHDDTAANMAGDSVFRNPSSSHGDRELPEISANGTGVSAVGESKSGTSFAAPAVAGVTALLQDVDPVLQSWPEGCRAILLAAASRNIEGQTWWQDVVARDDASDGAGAVDAVAGVRIAQQRRWRDAPATRRGWHVGTLSSAAVGSGGLATFRYHVTAPRIIFGPTVRVALAWDGAVTSSGDTATSSKLTVDLDLHVRDSAGSFVAWSASWDNSYEIVEFAARRGETYDIVIRRWSGTDSVWYGIAWDVTGFSLIWPWWIGQHDLEIALP